MEKPNPYKTWETFIPIPKDYEGIEYSKYMDILRFKVKPLIRALEKKNLINWYSFLVHNRKTSGLSQKENQNDELFVHIRLSFNEDLKRSQIEENLPSYCIIPIKDCNSKIKKTNIIQKKEIQGIQNELLKDEDINLAWKILGEASEWILNMLNIYKAENSIPAQQILQFIHFPLNMLKIKHKFHYDNC